MKLFRYPLALALFALVSSLTGASAQSPQGGVTEQDLLLALIATMIVISLVSLLLVITILSLVRQKKAALKASTNTAAEGLAAPAAEAAPALSWNWWNKKLTNAVPIAEEGSIDLGHEYDGIRELDNNLPPWWKYGFYFTIAWSVVYLLVFHVFGEWSSKGEYENELAEAEVLKAKYLERVGSLVDESSATLLTDASDIQAGKAIYTTNCVACHLANGGGGIGPNLTDAYWIHGGDVKDLFKTIKYGVIEKGMTPWQDLLKPKEMQQVASYILSELQGTSPEGGKEPQGVLWTPNAAPADTLATDTASIALNN